MQRGGRLTLLGAAEEGAVLLESKIHFDEICTREELHYHPRGDNGGYAQLHEGATV